MPVVLSSHCRRRRTETFEYCRVARVNWTLGQGVAKLVLLQTHTNNICG